jgi:hypothetical protein
MNEHSEDIRFLSRKEIAPEKWDQCISRAKNSLIYARSFYLDYMAKNWSALVLNDYEAVMPLTWNKKFGISYLYQPPFTAQLGIFMKDNENKTFVGQFISHAKAHFRFCEIHLNYDNLAAETTMRTNYVLDLGQSYEDIRRGYKKRLIENLHEAESYHLQYLPYREYAEAIQMFKKQYGLKMPSVSRKDFRHFENLCMELIDRNMIFARQVRDSSGELLNASIFFLDERRIYNIMSVSLPAGRAKRAHFYLLDRIIEEFSMKNVMLDMEGSDLSGVAEFYRKFGTVNQPYPFLRYNLLPFPLRMLK